MGHAPHAGDEPLPRTRTGARDRSRVTVRAATRRPAGGRRGSAASDAQAYEVGVFLVYGTYRVRTYTMHGTPGAREVREVRMIEPRGPAAARRSGGAAHG
ncbi:hypothetical protein FHS42_004966 [Streptomyces zagrosensis]|uniref:Uncharacterized protein n=1 Tax=Streptomyces zagrosensis TaxID=1042984 RepID=A0A7W9QF54_9ACTN|nr:hypothetical protein [Streptomyces zagrosensis]